MEAGGGSPGYWSVEAPNKLLMCHPPSLSASLRFVKSIYEIKCSRQDLIGVPIKQARPSRRYC
eukprot:scaffold686_cov245-Skeletonema_marinoi.AAC.35